MAWAMALTIIFGFAFNVLAGRSSFSAPLIVHLHAAIYLSWVALYLVQNALVAGGNRALHRKLGWLSIVLVPAMVIMGIAMTLRSLQSTGGPPFFGQSEFLFGNSIGIIGFAGLVGWAVILRHRTDWHRRLMFCAMASMTGPAFGRLLPMPLMIPFAWWVSNLVPLIFPLIGLAADRRRSGKAHPAWFWGMGILLAILAAGSVIAASGVAEGLTEQVLAGTPGEARDRAAFFPQ